jgi:hypothetical protein
LSQTTNFSGADPAAQLSVAARAGELRKELQALAELKARHEASLLTEWLMRIRQVSRKHVVELESFLSIMERRVAAKRST